MEQAWFLSILLAGLQAAAGLYVPPTSFAVKGTRGDYRVVLDKPAPVHREPPPIIKPPVTTDPIVEPIRVLPTPPIPAPKIVTNNCLNYRTIVTPRVYQRIIAVPKILRFLKKTYRPVVERVHYYRKPVAGDKAPGLTSLNCVNPGILRAL